ncbi:MAG: hypothetical protein ABUS49_08425 [Acidobacteriota bacterium]
MKLSLALLLAVVWGGRASLAQKGEIFFPPEIAPPGLTFRDVLRVDPVHYAKDFENERTRVLRLHLKADEAVPLHDARDGLFVCLRECHLRLTDPAGKLQDVHLENGQTRWIGAGTRTEKNLGTRPLEMLFIEQKPNSPA